MDTYMMMLYVSLEQEKALKQFFLDNGWAYCKPDLTAVTDSIGPLVAQTPHTKKLPASQKQKETTPNKSTPSKTGLLHNYSIAQTQDTYISEVLANTSDGPSPKKRKFESSKGKTTLAPTRSQKEENLSGGNVNLDGTVTIDEQESINAEGSTVTLLIEVDRNLLTGENNEEKNKEFIEIAREALKIRESSEIIAVGPPDTVEDTGGEETRNEETVAIGHAEVEHSEFSLLPKVEEVEEIETPDDTKSWYFEQDDKTCVMKKIRLRSGAFTGIKEDKGPYICDQCGKEYAVRTSLQRHLKSHLGDMKRCTACNQYFETEDELEQHNTKFHPGANLCETCGTGFTRKSALRKHMLKFHPEHVDAKFSCPFEPCKAAFDNKDKYEDHLNFHKGVKPHTCEVCQKSFASKCSLTNHMMIHSDEHRDLQCDQCELTFRSSGALSNHRNSVHGNVRYICHCSKAFKYKPGLIKHMKQFHDIAETSSETVELVPDQPVSTIIVETAMTDAGPELGSVSFQKL